MTPITGTRQLIEGRLMICPKCKTRRDILRYIPLAMVDEFVRETTPIYKCPSCRWLFAPANDTVVEILGV